MDDAARQAGIPIEEVFTYISDRMGKIDTLNFELRLVGQSAIKKALTKLSKLASQGQRVAGTCEIADDGKSRASHTLVSDDLEAAKALAKLGVDALKLARSGAKKAEETGDKDLFDVAPDPWLLKKVE